MILNKFFYKIQYFLLTVFIFISIQFPLLILNKVLFILILVFLLFDLKNTRTKFLFQPFIVFIIFLIGYNVSIYNFSNHEIAIQFLLSTLILFLIYPVYIYKIDIDNIVRQIGIIFSLITLAFAYVLVIDVTTLISELFLIIFNDYGAGTNSFRNIISSESFFMFHFGSVPFLFLPIAIYAKEFFLKLRIIELLYISLMLFIVFISTSRALFFLSILIFFIAGLFYLEKRKKLILIILFSLIFSFFVLNFYTEITYLFDLNEPSNNVKKGHIESFFHNLDSLNFIFGNGLGSYYFSTGKNAITAHTEITILDMIRYLGFIGTLVLYVIILNPNLHLRFKLKKDDIYYIIVILLYTIMSFTNPTMFNSYGLIVVLWYWNKMMIKVDIK